MFEIRVILDDTLIIFDSFLLFEEIKIKDLTYFVLYKRWNCKLIPIVWVMVSNSVDFLCLFIAF